MKNTKRVNMYMCRECERPIFTVDKDKGVTPMFLGCRATDGCYGKMVSAGYPPDDWFSLTPIKWEWYKPEELPTDDHLRDHVERGGLLLRKLPESIAMKDLPDRK
jgi:hypothetical protein